MPPKKVANKEKNVGKRRKSSVSEEEDESAGTTSKKAKTKTRMNKTDSVYNLEDYKCDAVSSSGNSWTLKISSWNVNGIRALIDKNGLEFLDYEKPDIFCVQETKCTTENIPSEANVDGYTTYWLSGDTEGYSGVGLYTKIVPEKVQYGIGEKKHDKEGRVITAEYKKFYLVVAYVPNAGRKLVRLDDRQDWDIAFRKYLKGLDKEKPVILCGDLNVAHQEIDLANPKTNKKSAGFTQEERDGFTALLDNGFIDSFRYLHPDTKGAYTFWTYMMNARAKNVGWRLDYFVLSERLAPELCESVIRKDVYGSDHCPITLFMSMKL